MRSESQPEPSRMSAAVLSATPSMTPTLAIEAPSTPTTKSGSTGTIISVETSVRSETKPSATTLRGRPGSPRGAGAAPERESGGMAGALSRGAAPTAGDPAGAVGRGEPMRERLAQGWNPACASRCPA